jgi:hypothetical protein
MFVHALRVVLGRDVDFHRAPQRAGGVRELAEDGLGAEDPHLRVARNVARRADGVLKLAARHDPPF